MSDEATMRLRLQQVAAYRELRRSVQRSGRENVIFALVMIVIAYFLHNQGFAGKGFLVLYAALIAFELLVGLFKWAVPVAEGLLLDALVMAAFVAFIGWIESRAFQNGGGLNPINIFFGFLLLSGLLNKLRAYGELRRLFAERPDPDHIAWFDDLVHEIRASDPVTDQLALDLPTQPYWKVKLLGSTAFFVAVAGNSVLVAGPDDFTLRREKADRGHGHRKALLSVYGEKYPEFDLSDASWNNYTRWLATQRPASPA